MQKIKYNFIYFSFKCTGFTLIMNRNSLILKAGSFGDFWNKNIMHNGK